MRNAEATRERILEAAMAEFSAHGIAGARVDRIAAAAGCNKNLIYIYFENKEALFNTVLQKNLLRVYGEIKFTPDDLPGYARRTFDFAMANPDLMRLMTWFGLEHRGEGLAERSAAFEAKVAVLAKAQGEGVVSADFPPTFLITAIMALATAWTAVNPFGASLDAAALEHVDVLRNGIVHAVERLVAPGTDEMRNRARFPS
ncbi:MAG: TetR family transcriptional regulator [Caulobacteraceae bacterium]